MAFEHFIKETHELVNQHRRTLGLPEWEFEDRSDRVEALVVEPQRCQCGCGKPISVVHSLKGWKYVFGHAPRKRKKKKGAK